MKKVLLIITLFLFLQNIFAQKTGKQFADSLINNFPSLKNDTLIIKSLNRIALIYVDINTDTAQKFADLGLAYATKIKWKKGVSAFYTVYGNIAGKKGNYDVEKNWAIKAFSISQEIKDTINMSVALSNIGTIEQALGNYVKAIDYYTKSLKLGEASNNNYMISMSLEYISSAHFYHKNYKQALNNSYNAIAYKKIGLYPDELLPHSYLINANCFRELNNIDSANFYYSLAINGYNKIENISGEATALSGYAFLLAKNNKYADAIKEAKQAEKLFATVEENFESSIENKAYMGSYYLQQSKVDRKNQTELINSAFKYLTDAKNKSVYFKNLSIYIKLLQSLAEVNAIKGNYKEAYLLHKEYKAIEDSVFSQENKNEIASSIAQISIDKKSSELQLQKAIITSQKKQKLFYIIGLCTLFLIGGLLYYQNQQRKKTNTTLISLNNRLDEANKVKAKFFGILSHDLRSPIASLVSFLQLQKNNPQLLSAEQTQAHHQKITQSAEALLDSMETMLLWSKSQMQNLAPQIKNVPVDNLFVYISNFFSHVDNIKFQFLNEQKLTLTTDENYLQTIMQNLTANAINAIGKKEDGKLIWQAIKKGNNIFLTITDNGYGLNEKQASALQQDNTSLPVGKGGFGFHIVKDLAKAIKCNISFESKLNEGTTFTLAI
ncbi:MAG: tetratricopeptide repeat-containing sensor histidine kinase [Ferruginibacter sp.]|nr:tetratricopeptide repeat-containing sensor histidine kinase [Ferruginibacter sp.]